MQNVSNKCLQCKLFHGSGYGCPGGPFGCAFWQAEEKDGTDGKRGKQLQ